MPDLQPTQLFQVEPSLAKTWLCMNPGSGVSIPCCFPVLDRLLLSFLSLTELPFSSWQSTASSQTWFLTRIPGLSQVSTHRAIGASRKRHPYGSIAVPGLHHLLFSILSHARSTGHRHSCLWGQKENILLSVFREAQDVSAAPSGSCILSETSPGCSPSRGRTNTLVLVVCCTALGILPCAFLFLTLFSSEHHSSNYPEVAGLFESKYCV